MARIEIPVPTSTSPPGILKAGSQSPSPSENLQEAWSSRFETSYRQAFDAKVLIFDPSVGQTESAFKVAVVDFTTALVGHLLLQPLLASNSSL